MRTGNVLPLIILFILFVLTFLTYRYHLLIEVGAEFPPLMVAKQTNDLLQQIKNNAKEYNEEAEDAYIDHVWKKTPGRNGRIVNVQKSYQNMKKEGFFDASLLVFDEIPPSTSLEDLPASPIYRGHPKKEMVALMINVSWGADYIPSILKTLKNENIKATFFIEGKWAKENKDIVKMIHEQNHLIGNHDYNQPDMAKISSYEIKEQIEQTNDIIETIIDKSPTWFAPPSGSYSNEVVRIVHEYQMETILWTVDTIDWQNPSVSVMINRVMKNIHPGAMVLMHPTEPVAQGLPLLIDEIKQNGYEIGTVENLLSEKR